MSGDRPDPALRVVAGRLSDRELAAVVVAVTALAAAEPEPVDVRPPAWRRAALAEHAGRPPAATPRDLDAARRPG